MINSEAMMSLRRSLGYMKWRIRTWTRARRIAHLYEDVNQVYWISPHRIMAALDFPGDPSPIKERGVIMDGDWDRKRIEWEDFDAWNAFQHRFLYNGRWEDTDWYKSLLNEIAPGRRTVYNCYNKMELDQHFKETDEIYRCIKEEGYRLQSELMLGKTCWFAREDEITVHIDRNGHYLLGDGRHRLFIARLLGLERVPIKVARRHVEWIKFRQDILDYAARGNGRVYQPLIHPDLADIPSVHGHERFDIIKKHLPLQQGTVLDLGANWGYFSHRFEDARFICTAVESFPTELYFLKRLRTAESRQFRIIEKSVLNLKGRLEYDVVLALNIFHHFLKEKSTYLRWLDLLDRIDAEVIVFQAHCSEEEQMKGSYMNYEPAEFANVISKKCGMKQINEVGRSADGRAIYILQK